jgi:hypothetical protein
MNYYGVGADPRVVGQKSTPIVVGDSVFRGIGGLRSLLGPGASGDQGRSYGRHPL